MSQEQSVRMDLSELSTVNDWSPTGVDHSIGVFLRSEGKLDWLVAPCSRTRDSEHLELSNWESMLKCLTEVDPDGNDYETLEFGHWGPGWYRVAIIRPGSKAHQEAVRIELALADYPVLDESDFSEREYDAQCEALADCIRSLTIEDDGSEVDSEQLAAAMFTDMWEHDQPALDRVNQSGGGSIRDNERDACLERLGYVLCEDDVWRPEGETEPATPEGWESAEA